MPLLQTILRNASVHRFAVFFLILIALILLPPYFQGSVTLDSIWLGLLSATLLWSIYAVADSRSAYLLTGLILLPTLISTWIGRLDDASIELHYLDNITNIAYFGLVSGYLAVFIFRSRKVTSEVLFAAMCLYISLAVLWGAIYTNIALYFEASYLFYGMTPQQAGIQPDQLFSYMMYYSFVTLSTLGYGDIIPVHRVAQNWAAVEAMIGQFYIAIVVARLVAMYTITQTTDTEG